MSFSFINFIIYPLGYIIFMPILALIHELGHAIPSDQFIYNFYSRGRNMGISFKKIVVYSISILSIICMLIGFFLKNGVLFTFGFYLHFIDATYVSLEEYKIDNKIKFKTIFYPTILGLFTIMVIYQLLYNVK